MPKPPASEPFKDRLKRLRLHANHTPSTLAFAVGITEGAIRQMENGQTKSASFAVGILLARELGVTPEYLAFGEEGLPVRQAPPQRGDALGALQRQLAAIEKRLAKLERPPR